MVLGTLSRTRTRDFNVRSVALFPSELQGLGLPHRTRTDDLRVRNPVRYPTAPETNGTVYGTRTRAFLLEREVPCPTWPRPLGAEEGTRTLDLRLTKALRCQLRHLGLEPTLGLEPRTYCLRSSCAAIALGRLGRSGGTRTPKVVRRLVYSQQRLADFALRYVGGDHGTRTRNLLLARQLHSQVVLDPHGQNSRTRTCDHLTPSEVRYQLRYALMVRMEGLEPSTTPSRRECATTALHSVGLSSETRTHDYLLPKQVGCRYRTLRWRMLEDSNPYGCYPIPTFKAG